MKRKLLIISTFLCFSWSVYSQESKDYLAQEEQYNKAVDLFQLKNYPAAYQLFSQLIEKENKLKTIPSETMVNAQLYKALSATYSGKQSGILLVEDFLETYPSHPNTSLARLELSNYYFQNGNLNAALEQLEQVNEEVLPAEQADQYKMNIGYTYFVKKQFSRAENYLQQVAGNYDSPNRNEAIYYLGLSQYFQEDYEAAMNNFLNIQDLPRYSSEVSYYRARIAFEKENYQQAITIAEPLVSSSSQNAVEISQIVGQSYFNLKEYEQALPYLERYSNNTSAQSAEAQYQLAYTQYQLEQYNNAVKNFEKLNIVNDEIGQNALYAMAQCYLHLNEKQKAKNAFGRAAKLNFNDEIKENALFNEAKLSYELERNNEAINDIQSFIEEYPRSSYRAEADEILVDLFLTSNNYKDALNILESMNNRSAKMNEAYQKVAYFRAVELYNNGHLSEAKPLFDKVLATPKDQRYVALANYWLGEMAYEYGRYNLSTNYIQTFLNSAVEKPERYISQANYTLGYSQFKQQNFQQAANYFARVKPENTFSNDAILRAADSNFANRNYNKSKQQYQSVNNDYATFQVAIINGLQGNYNLQLRQLQNLYTQQPNSAYADDALFEYARVFVTRENYSQAEDSFDRLISSYPESEKIVDAYNELGLINYNQQNYERAIYYYDLIVRNYSNSEEAASALSTIEDIYIQMGQPDEYFAYLETVDGVSVDASRKEEVVYQAAENQFQNGNCEKAVNGFTSYLNQYPRGIYASNAHFYRGECRNQNSQTAQALEDYEAVVSLRPNKFVERSLIRVARYNYRNGNYQQAARQFEDIQNMQGNSNSIYQDEVMIGLMQSYNQLGNRNRAANYAERVLQQANLDSSIETEAEFVIAVTQYENGNYEPARRRLSQVAEKTRNTYGAEARYLLARILHEQGMYEQSIEASYRVSDETPSEDNWVARSFILIADNYLQLEELFQAKATLESVIENYTGNDETILEEAKQKRAQIIAREKNESNLVDPRNSDNQLQLQDN